MHMTFTSFYIYDYIICEQRSFYFFIFSLLGYVFIVGLFIFSFVCHMVLLKYPEKETTIHKEI